MSTTKKARRPRKSSLQKLVSSYVESLDRESRPSLDRSLVLAGGHLLWALNRKKGEVFLFDSPKALYKTCFSLCDDGLRKVSPQSNRAIFNRMDNLLTEQIRDLTKRSSRKRLKSEDPSIRRLNQMSKLHRVYGDSLSRQKYRPYNHDLPNLAAHYEPSKLLEILNDRQRSVGSKALSAETSLEGWIFLGLYSPCFLFCGDDLFISRPPIELYEDYSGRINATDRPAIRFADDWSISVIGGVRVDEAFFSKDYEITAQSILDEDNMEVRRVMMERVGIDTFLEDIQAKEVANDDYGTLYVGMDDPQFSGWGSKEPLTYVRLLNSTPEPGTTDEFKEYLLRVPSDTKTPQAAVAWSFQLDEGVYQPLAQT